MMEAAPSNIEHSGLPDLESPLFLRRIEFHLATKPFNGFSGDVADGFKLIPVSPNPEMPKDSTQISKPEKLDRVDSGFDPDLSFEKSFRRIGAGLRNLGNTCYLNAVLQCLTYTEPLAAYLQSGKHQSSCRKAGFCALCAIQKHVSRALQETGRILEPKDLVSNLRSISRNFRNARQEDAHEYMVNLLESMHKCCLPYGMPSESPVAYEKSLVHKIFGGTLRSQVKCLHCSFCSNKYDPFLGLSLEIAKADSLRKALSHFTSKELLDGGAKQYQCQQCKQKVKALKHLTIDKAPHVLIIHLKRFSEHDPGKKINKDVAFEPNLDLKPFITGSYDGDLSYTLYGVLVHSGWNTHSGHYYCFIHTSNGMWYALDDNQVSQVNERRALDPKAYILFYVRDMKTLRNKKSVEMIKRESMVPNANGNPASSKCSVELKENIQNGSIATKLDGALPLPISERSGVLSAAPDQTNLDKECAEKSRVLTTNGALGLDTVSRSENLSAVTKTTDILKESGCETVVLGTKEVSYSEGAGQEHSDAKVIPPVTQSGTAVVSAEYNVPEAIKKQENDMHSMVSVEGNVHDQPTRKEDLGDNSMQSKTEDSTCAVFQNGSVIISQEFNILEQLLEKEDQNDVNSMQSKVEVASEMSVDAAKNAGMSGKSIIVEQEPQNGQINDHCMQSSSNKDMVVEVSLHAPAEQTLGGLMDSHSELSGIRVSEDLVLKEKIDKGHRLKVKKKSSKFYATTSPSSSIFFGFIMGNRKKLHNARKQHSLRKKEPLIKNTVNGCKSMLIDEPSVSGKSPSIMSVESARFVRNVSCGSVGIDKKSRASSHDSSMLAAGKPPSPLPSMSEPQIHDDDSLRKSRQVDVMSMLTQGLNRTPIPKWEDADVSPALTEAPKDQPIQIGYVGDEWDEEYDKGKRKKVRKNRVLFGGLNLFQEIATRKVKRSKLRHMPSAADHPFRIC